MLQCSQHKACRTFKNRMHGFSALNPQSYRYYRQRQTTTDNDRLAQSDEGDAADGSRVNQLDSLAQYRALQVYVH